MKFFLAFCLLVPVFSQATQPRRVNGGWPQKLNELTAEQLKKINDDISERNDPVARELSEYQFMSFQNTVGLHGIVTYSAEVPVNCREGERDVDSYLLVLYTEDRHIKQVNGSANLGCHVD